MPSSKLSQRADMALVERGFFESRAKARQAIAAGLVHANGKLVTKPAMLLPPHVELAAQPPYPWVSRGGIKLAAALTHFHIDPSGLNCLDIGASTGGFTDVLLQNGAAHVLAVDVGHAQLHPKIAANPRVTSLEGRDARSLSELDFIAPPSLVTCDVSFISLELILPPILRLITGNAMLICLIKPQFEAGPKGSVRGIVKDRAIFEEVCTKIEALIQNQGWSVLGLVPSPIEGGDGNREFLIGARRHD